MSKKEQIIEKLKENGCRITKQRKMLIDIILENECSSCKEIFYKASQADEKIGVATVYFCDSSFSLLSRLCFPAIF